MTHSSPALNRRAAFRALAAGGVLAATATLLGCSTDKKPHGVGGKHDDEQSRGLGPYNPTVTAAPGTLVMIIRHGEKPDNSSPGVDFSGNPADDSTLTQVGWNRARSLVDVFDPQAGQLRPGLARPKVIYAAGASDTGNGERTRETVSLLAQRLKIAVNTTFGKGDESALASEASSTPGPTLICWQHGEIPAIAEAFGTLTPPAPTTWPDDRYDVIWTLTATTTGWDFVQMPELALPGDQTQPISG